MDKDKFNELKSKCNDIPVENILSYFGINRKGNKYSCPFHDDKEPSAVIYKDINKLMCFPCNKTYDNIDLIMKFTNYKSVPAMLEDIFLFNGGEIKERIIKAPVPLIRDKNNNDNAKGYEKIKWFKTDKKATNEYLQSRGLNPVIAKKHLYNNGYRIGVDQRGTIVYDFNKFAIQKQKKGGYNWGTPAPILLFNKIKESNICFICEGIEDSLTALEMGYNVICLNSVSNVKKLFKEFSTMDIHCNYKYIIATDNDESGFNCMEQLEEYFKNNNKLYDVFIELYSSKKKDLNEYYRENQS